MSQNRVFKRPIPDANVPRNSFDRSKRISLNLSFGELATCYCNVALAGSRWQLDVQSFFRTAQLNTAAFPRLKMETEFFCVPIRFLWSYWDNFKLGISDYNSTALAQVQTDTFGQPISNPANVPCVDLFRLYKLMDGSSWLNVENFNKMCTPMYGRYKKNLFTGSFPSDSSEYLQKQMVSLLMPAAYQKIYYDHFRNTAYESNIPYAYNLDYLTAEGNGLDGITDAQLVPIFTKRYVNYRKDYFQSIFPSLNFAISSPTSPVSSLPSWIQGASFAFTNGGDTAVATTAASGPDMAQIAMLSNDYKFSKFTAQSIRAMFALDKLQRSSAYAPKHVKQQYEARYGIKFNDRNSFESQRIGAFSTEIAIGEVTSMANTGDSGDPLGAIGGKGVGGRDASKLLSYNVEEDSIIIGVCYAIPRTSYDAYRFPAWSLKISQNDFFIPEFMNLGLRPMYNKEFSTIYYDSNGNMKMQSAAGRNAALGYTLPYMEYKADVDENYGLFADKDSELGQFVVHSNLRSAAVVGAGVSSDYFKVKPADLNSIFVNQNDGTESTDQLFGEITFRMPVSQNMSVHGVPSL